MWWPQIILPQIQNKVCFTHTPAPDWNCPIDFCGGGAGVCVWGGGGGGGRSEGRGGSH